MLSGIPRNRRIRCKSCRDDRGQRIYMDDIENGLLRCPSCGRTVPHPNRKSRTPVLRSADPVRFRTRSGMGSGDSQRTGSWDGKIDSYQAPRVSRGKTFDQLPKPEAEIEAEIFDTPNEYQIVINLPYHKSPKDIKCDCEINARKLTVQSLIINYKEEFVLPEDLAVIDLEKKFNNGILTIRFKRAR